MVSPDPKKATQNEPVKTIRFLPSTVYDIDAMHSIQNVGSGLGKWSIKVFKTTEQLK